MKALVLAPLLALALAACAAGAQNISVQAAPPLAAPLSAEALKEHVRVLASDAFEGRAPATPGEKLTTDYISAQFKAAGLKPGGPNGSWLQAVPTVESRVTNAPALSISGADGAKTYAYRDQHVAWSLRKEAAVSVKEAPLVFVGYGVVAPELGWNDYAGADIKGKVAVILVNDPDFDTHPDHPSTGLFGGRAMTWYGRWPYKFEEAARQGAIGALLIHETAPAAYPFAVVQSSWTGPQFDVVRKDKGASRAAVEAWISTPMAGDLFKRAGLDFAALKQAAQSKSFKAKPMGLALSTTIEQTVQETVSNNVIGVLPGAERPKEYVVLSAHHDHLGRCPPIDGDDICNGALDNASGVAALIEMARFIGQGQAPKRSVLFVAYALEEKGLLGSAYFAESGLYAPKTMVANVNLDGMPTWGATRDLSLVGAGKNEVEDWLAKIAEADGRRVVPEAFPERGGYYRSDHFNLAKVGVPAIFPGRGIDLVEGGVEAGKAAINDYTANRYHKPADEFDPAADYSGVAVDVSLFTNLVMELANTSAWPGWKAGAEFKALREKDRAAKP